MAGTKSKTGKSGTPRIGGVSSMKAVNEDGADEQANEDESLDSNEMSKVGEIEAKHGVLGAEDQDIESDAAADDSRKVLKNRIDVDKLFGDLPAEYKDQVETFKKRNGKDVAATEGNYAKLARVAEKIHGDARRNGIALEEKRSGLGKGTVWDGDSVKGNKAGRVGGTSKMAASDEPGDDNKMISDDAGVSDDNSLAPIDNSSKDMVPAGAGGSGEIAGEKAAQEESDRVFNKQEVKDAAKAANKDSSSIWTKLRKSIWETSKEKDARKADERNKKSGEDDRFDWNEYTLEMNKIEKIEKSNFGLNLMERTGTAGVAIANSILGFLHGGAQEGEYDAPDDVYLVPDSRKKAQRNMDKLEKGFFSNNSKKKFQYEYDHIGREDEDGNVIVNDPDNLDFPNAYPDVEAEFTKRMADMGLNANTIIDIGTYTPEGNRDLYWQGRELLLAMSDFDPKVLANLKSVRLMTKEQYVKAADENSPNHDVYDKNVLEDDAHSAFIDGNLVVFLDEAEETDETGVAGRLSLAPEDMRNWYHQSLSEVAMSRATPEFRSEWDKVSMLHKNADGKYVANEKDLNTIIDAFSGVADVGKEIDPEQKQYLHDLFTQGFKTKDQEMAAAIEMYKNDRLPEILFKLRHDSPDAYAYLTKMMAVVDRFEDKLAEANKRAKAVNRPQPKRKKMSSAKAAELAAKSRALQKMAEEMSEKGVDMPDVSPPTAPDKPQPTADDVDWDDDEAAPQKPSKPKRPSRKPKTPSKPKPTTPAAPDNSKDGRVTVKSPVASLGTIGKTIASRLAQVGIKTVDDFIKAIVRGDKQANRVLGNPGSKTGQTRRRILWEVAQNDYGLTPEKAAETLGFPTTTSGGTVAIDWAKLREDWDPKKYN